MKSIKQKLSEFNRNEADYFFKQMQEINSAAFKAIVTAIDGKELVAISYHPELSACVNLGNSDYDIVFPLQLRVLEGRLQCRYEIYPIKARSKWEPLDNRFRNEIYPRLYQAVAETLGLENPTLYTDRARAITTEARLAIVGLLSSEPGRSGILFGKDCVYSMMRTTDGERFISAIVCGVRWAVPNRPDETIPDEEMLEWNLDFVYRGGCDDGEWLRLDPDVISIDPAVYSGVYSLVVKHLADATASDHKSGCFHKSYDLDMRFDGYDGDDYFD